MHNRSSLALLVACGLTPSVLISSPSSAQTEVRLELPSQPLGPALRSLANQTRTNILFDPVAVRNLEAPAVTGAANLEEVLAKILVGSGLTYRFIDARTVTLIPADPPAAKKTTHAAPTRSAERIHLAQVGSHTSSLDDDTASPDASANNPPARTSEREAGHAEEIVVTGTRLRGAPPTAPVRIVDREEIERSGYSAVGDVIRSLPENFGGGANPGHIGAPAANENRTNASTVNLRGLGDGATLVLLNGRRLPPETSRQSADISGIPISAIERVEVVKDGSSAIYGSDAVAGVVNFILRSDYDGMEVSARTGVATQGGGMQNLYSAVVGTSRTNWHATLSAEIADQDEISTLKRDVTSTAPDVPLSLQEDRVSVFLNAGGRLTDTISFDFDTLWSRRETSHRLQTRHVAAPAFSSVDVPGHLVSGTLTLDLPARWQLRVTGSTSKLRQDFVRRATTVSESYDESKSDGLEAAFDGGIPLGFGGDVQAAFGFGLRDEAYRFRDPTEVRDRSHDVRYVFGELLVPLVDPGNGRPGLRAFDVNLSARYENYSDFGESTTPRVGVRYVPMDGLTVRASWGDSFKVPSFTQVALVRSVLIVPASAMGGTSGGVGILAQGGNPDLRPEQSTSWTFSAEYERRDWSSLVLGASCFNVDYTDRVVVPVSPASTALSNPIFADYIIRNPSAGAQADVIARANDRVFNQTGAPYDPSTVVAMVINNNANAASQTAKGVDLTYRQTFGLAAGSLSTQANATWIQMHRRTLPTLPELELSGTLYNVPKWRARGGLSWTVGGLVASSFVNYQNGGTDNGIIPTAHIASWTTVDTNISYSFASPRRALDRLELTLSVQNAFDRDPPFAASPAILNEGIFFDSVNASAVGRFMSVRVRKAF